MRRLINYTVLFLLVGYLVWFGLQNRTRVDDLICTGVSVELHDISGTPFVFPAEIEKTIKKSSISPQGRPYKEIDTEAIERLLLKNQLIRTAQCYKTPSGQLRVDITQRVPILRIFGMDGNYYVDENGEIMPASSHFSLYLPVASGAITRRFAQDQLYPLARFLSKDDFWNSQIQQIYVQANGELSLIPRIGSHTIQLGKAEAFEQKLDNLMALYEQALPQVGWNAYETINLKYLNQVICTRRK